MKFVFTIFVLFAAIYLAHASFKNNDEIVLIASTKHSNPVNGNFKIILRTRSSRQVIHFDKTEIKGVVYLVAKDNVPKDIESILVLWKSNDSEELFLHNIVISYGGSEEKAIFIVEKYIKSSLEYFYPKSNWQM